MRKALFTLPLLISVAFFSVNNLAFAEPPKHGGGGPQGGPAGNPGGGHPQGGQPGGAMQHQGMSQPGMQQHGMQGGPGQGMRQQGMPGHQGGQEGNKGEHRMMGMENRDNSPRADRNNDGDIGPREAMRADQIQDQKHENMAERKHDMLDKNNDGNIGPRERAWAEAQSGESEFSPSSDMKGMADRNDDGLVDQFEKHQAQKRFAESQGSMDTPPVKPAAYESGLLASSQNSDGFLSSEGAYASDNLFDRADKNNDGALGPAERKMAREHMEQNQFDRKDAQMGQNQMENKFGEHRGFQEKQNGEFGRRESNGSQGFQGMNKGPQNGNFQGGPQGGSAGQASNMQRPSGMQGGPQHGNPQGNQMGQQHGGGQGGPGGMRGGPRK